MKTQLTIKTPQDAFFRSACYEQSVPFVCVEEHEDGNRYELTCEPFELYYLGVNIGLKISLQISIQAALNK